jgi:hypothetical protein
LARRAVASPPSDAAIAELEILALLTREQLAAAQGAAIRRARDFRPAGSTLATCPRRSARPAAAAARPGRCRRDAYVRAVRDLD